MAAAATLKNSNPSSSFLFSILDPSTSPDSTDAILVSELAKIKSSLVSDLLEIDPSFPLQTLDFAPRTPEFPRQTPDCALKECRRSDVDDFDDKENKNRRTKKRKCGLFSVAKQLRNSDVGNLRETDPSFPLETLYSAVEESDRSDVDSDGEERRRRKKKKESDSFPIAKRLENSDVGNLCRLMLKKQWVETLILPLWTNEENKSLVFSDKGFRAPIFDQDTGSLHALTFKMWVSSKCYIFNNNWSVDFVKRRGLQAGDTIGLRWDDLCGHFCFSVLDRATAEKKKKMMIERNKV